MVIKWLFKVFSTSGLTKKQVCGAMILKQATPDKASVAGVSNLFYTEFHM